MLVWYGVGGSNKTILAKRVRSGQGQCVLVHDWINLDTEVMHFSKRHIFFQTTSR